ncbi:hypothetical protein FVEG_15131 [Fusarium verticillioides 7600]|uniref:Uncharacterized protein n=1 Tax=Gibberella moniliformis (strain M3125 / FGSC 7600) TaxID=334819 RepID=W7LLX9_GIBM7|nr:hypothetical protein FVEG_15131 [Fusarium verticillioides 7600]XP_018746590.1 hypothetical protein FVEG_15131 [Fusarium verticillioides 7600]EWG40398.1 hypothetical protein FVEG_15131 [Fusarium verticillioides 7600]EWG40399.1 hypothetical protein FVEG_15131 [Fusarium verticillioides 7600]
MYRVSGLANRASLIGTDISKPSSILSHETKTQNCSLLWQYQSVRNLILIHFFPRMHTLPAYPSRTPGKKVGIKRSKNEHMGGNRHPIAKVQQSTSSTIRHYSRRRLSRILRRHVPGFEIPQFQGILRLLFAIVWRRCLSQFIEPFFRPGTIPWRSAMSRSSSTAEAAIYRSSGSLAGPLVPTTASTSSHLDNGGG